MKRSILMVVVFFLAMSVQARQTVAKNTNYMEATVAFGSYEGSLSLLYMHDWRLGAKRKWGIGLGGRINSYLGANQYYITAPAQLTSESTSPFIFFKENVSANIDSLLVKSPQVNSLNATFNIDYRLFDKITIAFNIDVLGFTFGGRQRGNYINGFQGKNTQANPTALNALLISDNDRGSLNSELYGNYFIHKHWAVKAGAQFLFTEYTTVMKVQELPLANDRFRNKSLLFALGVSYHFKERSK